MSYNLDQQNKNQLLKLVLYHKPLQFQLFLILNNYKIANLNAVLVMLQLMNVSKNQLEQEYLILLDRSLLMKLLNLLKLDSVVKDLKEEPKKINHVLLTMKLLSELLNKNAEL